MFAYYITHRFSCSSPFIVRRHYLSTSNFLTLDFWYFPWESNPQTTDFESARFSNLRREAYKTGSSGLNWTIICGATTRRHNRLDHSRHIWSWGRDSNPHCTVSKTGASYQLGYLRINIGRSISPHIELELFYNVCSILFTFTFPGASDGNRTRIVCLEGRSVSHYTTPAYFGGKHWTRTSSRAVAAPCLIQFG